MLKGVKYLKNGFTKIFFLLNKLDKFWQYNKQDRKICKFWWKRWKKTTPGLFWQYMICWSKLVKFLIHFLLIIVKRGVFRNSITPLTLSYTKGVGLWILARNRNFTSKCVLLCTADHNFTLQFTFVKKNFNHIHCLCHCTLLLHVVLLIPIGLLSFWL